MNITAMLELIFRPGYTKITKKLVFAIIKLRVHR